MPSPSHRLYRADFDPVIHSDADTRHDCGYSAALRDDEAMHARLPGLQHFPYKERPTESARAGPLGC